jgi:hypothetical protein
MDPRDVGGKFDRLARAIDDDQPRTGDHLLEPLPGVQPGGGVVTDDREQLRPRMLSRQRGQRVCRVARPAGVDLEPSGGQARNVGDGRGDHLQAVEGRRDRPFALLLPGDVGDHQDHGVERQGVAHVDGGDEVTDVGRVEGAAEQADPSTCG